MEDYKEKYEQALSRARNIRFGNPQSATANTVCEEIFPELKESEDEKIRKELIEYFTWNAQQILDNFDNKDVITWLEKQEERKSADKVEPKFKVGDWVVYERSGNTYQIHSIDNHDSNYIVYACEPLLSNNDDIPCFCEEMIHLWTIQDAKKGDVLAWYDSKCIALFKEIYDNDSFKSYGFVGACTGVFENGAFHDIEDAHPATQEQCDLLFTKMKEAGYEWDAEDKVLGKIEQKPQTELPKGEDYGIDSLYHAVRILEKTLGEVEGYQSDDGILGHKCAIEAVRRLYEQKATWSEEDEVTLNNILNDLSQNVIPDDEDTQWLKSLKKRVRHQPKQ